MYRIPIQLGDTTKWKRRIIRTRMAAGPPPNRVITLLDAGRADRDRTFVERMRNCEVLPT